MNTFYEPSLLGRFGQSFQEPNFNFAVEEVRRLIGRHENVNKKDSDGYTPLEMAIIRNLRRHETYQMIRSTSKIVKLLLEAGAVRPPTLLSTALQVFRSKLAMMTDEFLDPLTELFGLLITPDQLNSGDTYIKFVLSQFNKQSYVSQRILELMMRAGPQITDEQLDKFNVLASSEKFIQPFLISPNPNPDQEVVEQKQLFAHLDQVWATHADKLHPEDVYNKFTTFWLRYQDPDDLGDVHEDYGYDEDFNFVKAIRILIRYRIYAFARYSRTFLFWVFLFALEFPLSANDWDTICQEAASIEDFVYDNLSHYTSVGDYIISDIIGHILLETYDMMFEKCPYLTVTQNDSPFFPVRMAYFYRSFSLFEFLTKMYNNFYGTFNDTVLGRQICNDLQTNRDTVMRYWRCYKRSTFRPHRVPCPHENASNASNASNAGNALDDSEEWEPFVDHDQWFDQYQQAEASRTAQANRSSTRLPINQTAEPYAIPIVEQTRKCLTCKKDASTKDLVWPKPCGHGPYHSRCLPSQCEKCGAHITNTITQQDVIDQLKSWDACLICSDNDLKDAVWLTPCGHGPFHNTPDCLMNAAKTCAVCRTDIRGVTTGPNKPNLVSFGKRKTRKSARKTRKSARKTRKTKISTKKNKKIIILT
jgi:hypothetical protein